MTFWAKSKASQAFKLLSVKQSKRWITERAIKRNSRSRSVSLPAIMAAPRVSNPLGQAYSPGPLCGGALFVDAARFAAAYDRLRRRWRLGLRPFISSD